jgi:phosphoglycerate dehydrogenase-like enzyme
VIGLGTKNRIQTSDVDKWFNSTAKGGVMGFLKQNLDFIVNCMPRHKSTRHLLDARKLLSNKAKSSNLPVLINVGNGDLIKEKDLEALLVGEQRTKGGGISHAILDAHEGDTLSPDSKLWDSPHVTISPRVAGMSGMCAYPISDMFSEALVLFLEHKHIPRSIFINNLDDFSVADPRAHRRSNTHRRSNSQMQ